MSIKLKREKFQVQIRNENKRIKKQNLKQKRYQQKQVNEIFKQFLQDESANTIPQLCVFNFELIYEENLSKWFTKINMKQIMLDFSKPQNIAFFNKFCVSQDHFSLQVLQQTTKFANKLNYTIKGNQQLIQQPQLKSLCPSKKIQQSLTYLPNCFLQYWSLFFINSFNQIQLQQYLTMLRSFIYWYNSEKVFKYLNKYSLIHFVYSLIKNGSYFKNLKCIQKLKGLQKLTYEFQKTAVLVIDNLIAQKFFCEDLIQCIQLLIQKSVYQNNSQICKRLLESDQLFDLIKTGLQPQVFYYYNLKSMNQKQYLHTQQLSQFQLQTLKGYTIQQTIIIKKDVTVIIKQSRLRALALILSLTQCINFQKKLFSTKFQQILSIILSLYTRCITNQQIKVQIQNYSCQILYNVIILAENLGEDQWGKHQQSNYEKIQFKLAEFINSINFQDIINDTFTNNGELFINFIDLLKQIIFFTKNYNINQQICEKIFFKGQLFEKGNQFLNNEQINESQKQQIAKIFGQLLIQNEENLIAINSQNGKIQQLLNNLINQSLVQYLDSKMQIDLTNILKNINISNCQNDLII